MPLGIGNLLSALDQNDIGDIAGAVKDDPSLLQPPKKGMAGELATAANNLTQFFGLLFNDDNALKVAQQTKVADEARDFEAVQQKLIPVIAEGRQKRLEQARQDKLEAQREQQALREQAAEDHRITLYDHMSQNWAAKNDDGSIRDLTAAEIGPLAAAMGDAYNDPSRLLAGPPEHMIPPNIVAYGPAQREADRQKRAADAADAAMRKSGAVQDSINKRQFDRETTRATEAEEKATAKANAAALAQLNGQLNAAEAQARAAALKLGAPPAAAEAQAREAVRTGAVAMALDVAGDPAAWDDVPRLRTIANRADMNPAQLKSWGERIARGVKAAGVAPSPKLNAFLDSIGVGK